MTATLHGLVHCFGSRRHLRSKTRLSRVVDVPKDHIIQQLKSGVVTDVGNRAPSAAVRFELGGKGVLEHHRFACSNLSAHPKVMYVMVVAGC